MTELTRVLLEQALKLPADDREALAEHLFASLDSPADVESAWTAEAKRRRDEARRDPSLMLDGEQVFDEAHSAIGAARLK